jgi:hypothetical protein
MNEAEVLIRSMNKAGSQARAIATELYDRGLRNGRGQAFSPDMVEGYLRYLRVEDEKAPSVEQKAAKHSKDAEPIANPIPKVRMLRPWPLHTDFSPDNLNIKD